MICMCPKRTVFDINKACGVINAKRNNTAPVSSDHLLDYHPRDIDICKCREAVVEHFFAQP